MYSRSLHTCKMDFAILSAFGPIARSPTIPKCIQNHDRALKQRFCTPSRRGHPSVQLSTRALLAHSHVYGIELALLKSAKSKPPKWLKRARLHRIRLCDTKWQNTHTQQRRNGSDECARARRTLQITHVAKGNKMFQFYRFRLRSRHSECIYAAVV